MMTKLLLCLPGVQVGLNSLVGRPAHPHHHNPETREGGPPVPSVRITSLTEEGVCVLIMMELKDYFAKFWHAPITLIPPPSLSPVNRTSHAVGVGGLAG
jgi:hypothetical protein